MPGQATFRVVSMTAITADDTRGSYINALGYPYVTAYVTGTGTITSGLLSFEEASWGTEAVPYGGTWSDLGSAYDVTAANITAGATVAVHFPVRTYHYLRPFIETAIGGGGSISVVFVGQGAS